MCSMTSTATAAARLLLWDVLELRIPRHEAVNVSAHLLQKRHALLHLQSRAERARGGGKASPRQFKVAAWEKKPQKKQVCVYVCV